VLPLADVLHLLVDEFSSLGAGGLALPRVLLRALDDVLLWHDVFLLDLDDGASGVPWMVGSRRLSAAAWSKVRLPISAPELSSIEMAQRASLVA
jgi:hypothetical protein